MNNNPKGIRYPRSTLSSRWQASTPRPERFAISIDRPIVLDGDGARASNAEYARATQQALKEAGEYLPRGNQRAKRREFPRKFELVRPDNLKLVHLQPEVLASQAVDMFVHHDERKLQMERLARMLQERLHFLYKDLDPLLPIRLGQLSLGPASPNPSQPDLGSPEESIVARPIGWHGHGANYTSHDPHKSTLGVLASDGISYQEAILQLNPYFEPRDIVTDPRATVLTKRGSSLPAYEVSAIEQSFAYNGLNPCEMFIGDPSINVVRFTDMGFEVLEQLEVRDLGRNPIAA